MRTNTLSGHTVGQLGIKVRCVDHCRLFASMEACINFNRLGINGHTWLYFFGDTSASRKRNNIDGMAVEEAFQDEQVVEYDQEGACMIFSRPIYMIL